MDRRKTSFAFTTVTWLGIEVINDLAGKVSRFREEGKLTSTKSLPEDWDRGQLVDGVTDWILNSGCNKLLPTSILKSKLQILSLRTLKSLILVSCCRTGSTTLGSYLRFPSFDCYFFRLVIFLTLTQEPTVVKT